MGLDAPEGRVSVSVSSLLQQYKEYCRTERPWNSSESPAAQSEALETGAVNEEAREVVASPRDRCSQ